MHSYWPSESSMSDIILSEATTGQTKELCIINLLETSKSHPHMNYIMSYIIRLSGSRE